MQPFSYNNRTWQSNQLLLPQPQEKQKNRKNHKGIKEKEEKMRANKK